MIRDSAFRPAWWLPGPHLQTIWPSVIRRRPPVAFRRERFELPDGDFVDLDWSVGDGASSAPVVLVLHGLEGSAQSNYASGLVQALGGRGWRALVLNFRGCSGEINRLPRAYHAGDTDDVRAVLTALRQRFPDAPLAAVGYSIGGNVLLKYLGEEGARALLLGSVAVSVPLVLSCCAARLQRGASRIYDRWLLRSLRASLERKLAAKHLDPALEAAARTRLDSVRTFDDRITAPLHGFANAEDYYTRSSSRQFLKKVEVPTLIIHARDDPFMTEAVLPAPAELAPAVTLELSRSGGHVGFVGGRSPLAPDYWLETRVPEFLDPHLARVELRDRGAA